VGRITLLLMVLTKVSGMRYHEPSARRAPPHRRLLQSPPDGLTAHGNGDVRRAPARSHLSCSGHS
jgi:hypothetical protein